MKVYEEYPDLLKPSFVDDFQFDNSWTASGAGFSVLDVAVALLRTDGVIKEAAQLLSSPRTSLARFIKGNRVLRELQEEVEDSFLDEVESHARLLARAGDKEMVKFYLTTVGKERGFTTRQEQSGPGGGPIPHVHSEMDAQEAAVLYAQSLGGNDGT